MTLNLEELKELAAAATPGPWCAKIQRGKGNRDLGWIIEHDNGRIGWASLAYADTNAEAELTDPARDTNARFIAASRTATPALVEEVERLREALKYIADHEGRFTEEGHEWCVNEARAALGGKHE